MAYSHKITHVYQSFKNPVHALKMKKHIEFIFLTKFKPELLGLAFLLSLGKWRKPCRDLDFVKFAR